VGDGGGFAEAMRIITVFWHLKLKFSAKEDSKYTLIYTREKMSIA